MIGKISDRTCNGQCSRCGECCGIFIPFTEKELSIIKEYVSKHNIQPINRFTPKGMEAMCCFYDNINHKCNIYEVRPYACRDFKCCHKDWLKRRDHYERRSKYNSTVGNKFIAATFDDLIYNDYRYILQYFITLAYDEKSKGVDSEKLLKLLKMTNREDTLQYITAYDENGNKIKGTDLK